MHKEVHHCSCQLTIAIEFVPQEARSGYKPLKICQDCKLLNLLCPVFPSLRDHRGFVATLTRYILPSAAFAPISNIPDDENCPLRRVGGIPVVYMVWGPPVVGGPHYPNNDSFINSYQRFFSLLTPIVYTSTSVSIVTKSWCQADPAWPAVHRTSSISCCAS